MFTIGFDAKRYFLNRSGLGNYSRDLIRQLETYYPENSYLKYTPKLGNIVKLDDKELANTRLPKGYWNKLLSSYWRNQGIVHDLKADHVDIFHGLSGEIPVGLRKNKIKSVVTIHDLIFLRYPELYNSIDRMIYSKKTKHALEESDMIIAISKQSKQDIIEFYGTDANKIEVIYQGCHPAFKRSKSEAEKEAIRKKYNLPETFLLNVGSIEPRKNAFQIVKAIKNIDIPLLIIGKPTAYSKEIEQYIHEHGLQNRIRIMQGFSMDELACIYAMAKIFIYPSKFEGFGIPIIEALYSETPVITNKYGVFPEAAGPFSYYIDPENIEELSYAIQSVLKSSNMQQEMKSQGLIYAQQFQDNNIASQLISCYKTL